MKASEQINELATAFAKAQAEFHNPEKDREVEVTMKTGGKYKFLYATFSQIVGHVRPILGANGLSFVQVTVANGENFDLRTRLMHGSGQWIESDTPVIWEGGNAQAFGSGITYAKRYALSAMLGLAADDDDDGNEASGNKADFTPRRQSQPATNGHANGNGKPAVTEHWTHFRSDCDALVREFPNVYADWNAICEHAQFVLRGKNIDPALFPDWFSRKAEPDKLERMYLALVERTNTAPALGAGEIPF